MYNPFIRFSEKLIAVFRNAKKRYLVSQTFHRVDPPGVTEPNRYIMVTHYDNIDAAKVHFNAVSFDKFASVIDLEKDVHREKLLGMLQPGSGYIIYSSLTVDAKELKRTIDDLFKDKVQKFIRTNTSWRITRDHIVKPRLEITFGELYVVIKYGSQTIRVKLEELENV